MELEAYNADSSDNSHIMEAMEAMITAMKPIAGQLAGTLRVGMLEVPRLRRWFWETLENPSDIEACTFAATDAFLWLAQRRGLASILPVPFLGKRILEDVADEVLHASRLASRLQSNETRAFAWSRCDVFLGPVQYLGRFLRRMSRPVMVCCYGLVAELDMSTQLSRKVVNATEVVATSLSMLLHHHGWQSDREDVLPSCILENGWRNLWQWSVERRESAQQNKKRTMHFGCCFRAQKKRGSSG